MAGTRTTPPPMPRRPTSTPTPRPSRRMINVMVTGPDCSERIASMIRAAFSIFHPPARWRQPELTSCTLGDVRLFLFARNLLYLLVFVTSACGQLVVVRPIARQYPRKRESLGPDRAGVRQKEECDGIHANRPETRVFQRCPSQSGNYWLRLCRPAAGAAFCRSGTQSHGI